MDRIEWWLPKAGRLRRWEDNVHRIYNYTKRGEEEKTRIGKYIDKVPK